MKYLKCSGEYWDKQRMRTLVRDDFTCQAKRLGLGDCEENRLRFLHVHHKKARINGGTHDLDNLITICRVHHMDIHPHMKYDLSPGNTPSFDLPIREL